MTELPGGAGEAVDGVAQSSLPTSAGERDPLASNLPKSAGALVRGSEPVKITYGSVGKGGLVYELPRVIAMEQGFYAAQGIEIETIDATGSTSQVAKLIAGDIDVATTGPSAPIGAMLEGEHLRVFGPWLPLDYMAVYFGDDCANANEPFPASMECFVGQSVGVPELGGPGDLFIRSLMKEAGLEEDAVTFIVAGAPTAWVAAIEAGQITAGVLAPTGVALFRHQSIDVTVLADPLHGNGGSSLNGVAGAVMAAGPRFVEDGDVFDRFWVAMAEAVTWMADPAHRGAGVALLADQLGLPPNDAGKLWDAQAPSFRMHISEQEWRANVAWTTSGRSQLPYADAVHNWPI